MKKPLVLASGSAIRAQLLRNAGLDLQVQPARIDESAVRYSLLAEGASPRDIADTLAEMKARKISEKLPGRLVLGCDQVLDLAGSLISKPSDRADAEDQLRRLSGKRHMLLSAAVLVEDGKPVWRHIGTARLHMRTLSASYITSYLDRNWDSLQDTVGVYKLEAEGVRLFTRVDGDYFTVLGLPLLELISHLTLTGVIDG